MTNAASVIETVQGYQATLSALTALSLTAYRFPQDTAFEKLLAEYDYAIIGGGSAGCLMASRLSEDPTKSVLLVEAGDVPPVEVVLPGLFSISPNTRSDWNLTTRNNHYSDQNLVDHVSQLTKGKVLGGSSCLDHMMYIRANREDLAVWQDITGYDELSYENLLPYFKKYENIVDKDIMAEFSDYHGDSGPIKITRQPNTENIPILEAFNETGHNVLLDINADKIFGYYEPSFFIADGVRFSSSESYLRNALNRSNLHVKYNTLVTKIIFDSNNTAIGIEILDSDNVSTTINVNIEVVLSAGAIHTPAVLLNSGVGDKETLDKLGKDIVTELPVGKNLVDHCGVIIVYTLGQTTETKPTNYHEFPMPVTVGSAGLNNSENAVYQTVNLKFDVNSISLGQFCSWIFKYNAEICQQIYDINEDNDILISVLYLLHPKSRGQVTIDSTDPTADPIVDLNHLSDESDLDVLSQSVMDFMSIADSTYFKSLNSKMLQFNLTNCNDLDPTSMEYMRCYVLEMSATMWHYCSTCPMGTVLNSDMTVKNTNNLRVVDASAMPYTLSGKTLGGVYALGERAAELMKKKTATDN